jgi:hypothetical protein
MANIDTNSDQMETLAKQVKRLESEKKAQEAQMADLLAQFEQFKQSIGSQEKTTALAPMMTSAGEMVKIVHMLQMAPGLTTHAELQTTTIDLTTFEELIGKYRHWFDKGILAVSSECEYYAKRYMLQTNSAYFMNSDFIKNLGDMSMAQLNDIFPKLPLSHKEFVVAYWKQHIVAGDNRFNEAFKLETLNRLTEGAFKTEILALAR